MLNNLLTLLSILSFSNVSMALLSNKGNLYVPYKDQEKSDLKNIFTKSNLLSATYMTIFESIVKSEDETRLFFIEDSYQKSSSLNILMFDSSETSYNAALLTVDYSELQRRVCEEENNQTSACESKSLNINKLIVSDVGSLSLTVLGKQILLPALKSALAISSYSTISELKAEKYLPTVNWGFFFTYSENNFSRFTNIQYSLIRSTEVRLNSYESFLTKTEVTLTTSHNYYKKLFENTVYAKFPIKNKINLKEQQ